jgi:hypothetical protein
MLDDLRSALGRLERQPKDQMTRPSKALADKAPASEAGTGSRQDNASNKDSRASRKPN